MKYPKLPGAFPFLLPDSWMFMKPFGAVTSVSIIHEETAQPFYSQNAKMQIKHDSNFVRSNTAVLLPLAKKCQFSRPSFKKQQKVWTINWFCIPLLSSLCWGHKTPLSEQRTGWPASLKGPAYSSMWNQKIAQHTFPKNSVLHNTLLHIVLCHYSQCSHRGDNSMHRWTAEHPVLAGRLQGCISPLFDPARWANARSQLLLYLG